MCKYRLSRVKQRNSHLRSLDTNDQPQQHAKILTHVLEEHNSSLIFNNILLTPASGLNVCTVRGTTHLKKKKKKKFWKVSFLAFKDFFAAGSVPVDRN